VIRFRFQNKIAGAPTLLMLLRTLTSPHDKMAAPMLAKSLILQATKWLVVCSTAVMGSTVTAFAAPYRAYPGPALPKQQVAVLKLSHLWVTAVDGAGAVSCQKKLDHFRSFYKVTWADALVRGPAPWPGSVARDSRPARRDRGSRAGQGTRPTLR
jgi:hypothetical protein